jgi:hypothetical protein
MNSVMAGPATPVFTPAQLRLVSAALEAAEGKVAHFYGIAPREWSLRFRYDVGTVGDEPELGFDPRSMAQLLRPRPCSRGRRPRFRIALRDAAILATGRRLGLRRTLLGVLTHELVHVVRFSQNPALFDARGQARYEEERRVLELTGRILSPAGDHRLRALLRRMAPLSPVLPDSGGRPRPAESR